jgi:hypothetical protein
MPRVFVFELYLSLRFAPVGKSVARSMLSSLQEQTVSTFANSGGFLVCGHSSMMSFAVAGEYGYTATT